MKRTKHHITALLLAVFFTGTVAAQGGSEGKLFIIGGGKRPPSMIIDLLKLSLDSSEDYILMFPHASSIPDTSFFYARKQFSDQGYTNVVRFKYDKNHLPTDGALDSLRNAKLIYFGGGAQDAFMSLIGGTPIEKALHEAYRRGAVIAGTSAGAAVMSEVMITGDEYKHPDYTGDFRTIEAKNLVYAKGLGLITTAIVDQHFIWRMRMNRLITAVLDHPDLAGIGIDESTAFLVEGNKGTVYGTGQVIFLRHGGKTKEQDGLLGGKNLRMDILLPGDQVELVK